MDDNVFGMRLRQARQAGGYSLRALSAALAGKVSAAQLGKYENGKDLPGSAVLLALADLFRRKPDDFFRPLIAPVQELNFRARALGVKQRRMVTAEAVTRFERYCELEAIVGCPEIGKLPLQTVARAEDAETAAEKVREKWELGRDPITNLTEIAENNGVKICRVPDFDGFDGCCGVAETAAGRVPLIAMPPSADLARYRFTLAHELGHLLLRLPEVAAKEKEKMCHRFAGALLLPRAAAWEILGRGRDALSWNELCSIKMDWGLSLAGLVHRAADLGIISAARARGMWINYKSRGWNAGEPAPFRGYGNETCLRFRRLLCRGLAEEKLTLAKAAALAGTSVTELQGELARQLEGGDASRSA